MVDSGGDQPTPPEDAHGLSRRELLKRVGVYGAPVILAGGALLRSGAAFAAPPDTEQSAPPGIGPGGTPPGGGIGSGGSEQSGSPGIGPGGTPPGGGIGSGGGEQSGSPGIGPGGTPPGGGIGSGGSEQSG